MRYIAILTFYFLCYLGSCIGKQGEDSIFLIPEGFEGNIVIVFNQRDGQTATYENGKRKYEFDTTGILNTQFTPNYGVQRNYYFYLDSAGKRAPLEVVSRLDNIRDSNKVVCYSQEMGNWFDDSLKAQIHIEVMTVAKVKNLSYWSDRRSDFIWNKIR